MRHHFLPLSIGLILAVMATAPVAQAVDVSYELRMTQPHTHYFEVTMRVKGLKKDDVDFVMPVWTPGSYLVREFAKNVIGFSAETGSGQELVWKKVNKNTWRVRARKSSDIIVRYRVYAFEMSVRTSFLDDSHGYINGASVFMYVDGLQSQPLTLRITPYKKWKKISTGLERLSSEENLFAAPNYDILVDSPIEIGNQDVYEFKVRDVPHYVAIYGEGNYDAQKLVDGMQKIVEVTAEMFGGLPYRDYTFIVHMLQRRGGGLEHLNSTTLQTRGFGFEKDGTSKRFFSLTAHEFFHTWNVKRIRPRELGPFDYTRENYTTLLWVAEGFTSYYAPVLLRRAGIYTPERFLKSMAGQIRTLQRTPGRLFQSVSEASFDAWIKYYRRNENSINSEVSYYNKGAVLGMLLDLQIRYSTQNKRSLDDLMIYLYREYALNKGRGFTEEEFQRAAEKIAGAELDRFFRDYVYGTTEIDYDSYLRYAGLRLQVGEKAADDSSDGKAFLGIGTAERGGLPVIRTVYYDSPAYRGGLNVNDELIAINGLRVSQGDWQERISDHQPGDTVRVTVGRQGRLREFDIVLASAPPSEYQIEKLPEADDLQRAIYEGWTGESWATEENAN
jgi:predicted metalloprotease with PDZ domain